jgi:hypothetical protein
MAQCSVDKHDQGRGYMTILVINQGLIKSISLLTADICPMIKFDVNKPQDYFRQEV